MELTRFHKPLNANDQVEITVTEIVGIPKGSNPFNHDLWRMGANLTDSYMAMFNTGEKPTEHLILVNQDTGQRFELKMSPKTPTLRKIVKVEPELDTILGEELFLFQRTYCLDNGKATYSGVDATDLTDQEDVFDLWLLHKGHMVEVSLLQHRHEFMEEWENFTFEELPTDDEFDKLVDQVLDATPNVKLVAPSVSQAPQAPFKFRPFSG